MSDKKLIDKIIAELKSAKLAQIEGKLGLARVHARRAAGWAIREKLNKEGVALNSPSAFEYIKYYADQENVDPQIKNVLAYLQIRVKKDALEEDSYWPLPEIDLITEAQALVEELLDIKVD